MICPICKSEKTKMIEDRSDEWHDLCLVCHDCGYDERKQKTMLKNIKKNWL